MSNEEYKDVKLKVEKDFINKLGQKLNKKKCGEVVCEALELMSWFLDKIEEGDEIVAVNLKTGEFKEKFTTEGLTHFRNVIEKG